MTKLLEKDAKFKWSPQCEEAFLTLKKLLTTALVLAQPDIEKPFDVYCDASSTGIRGVLMQDGRAIAYASRQLQRLEVLSIGKSSAHLHGSQEFEILVHSSGLEHEAMKVARFDQGL
jgi:hypothetical protein